MFVHVAVGRLIDAFTPEVVSQPEPVPPIRCLGRLRDRDVTLDIIEFTPSKTGAYDSPPFTLWKTLPFSAMRYS
jgi:hypothetical protein